MTPNDVGFFFVAVPLPVISSGRFSRVEQLVIGAIVTEYLTARKRRFRLSVNALARTACCKWQQADQALQKAIESGFLVHYRDGLYDLKIPVMTNVEVNDEEDSESAPDEEEGLPSHGGGGNQPGAPQSRGKGLPSHGGRGSPATGEEAPQPRGTIRSLRSEKRSDPEARPSRATGKTLTSEDRISLPSKERSREITDWGEEEEENPDGESKTAAAAIERRKAARAARRETKTQTKKLRVKTADDFVGSFSERPQVVAAASRPVTSGRALVMYWARRFREVTGSEDAELRFPNLEAEPFRILSRNVTLHVNNFLGGDWEDAKKAVDEILERAERLGYPRKMSYFFTPSKDGAMLAIRANRRKDGKKTAPYQNDDIYGSNRKLFQENPKFQEYKARMKKMVEGHTT